MLPTFANKPLALGGSLKVSQIMRVSAKSFMISLVVTTRMPRTSNEAQRFGTPNCCLRNA